MGVSKVPGFLLLLLPKLVRRVEELTLSRQLADGIGQYVFGLPSQPQPHISSVWLCSDGYFYLFRLDGAVVTHRAFVTQTPVLTAAWIIS